MAELLMSRKEIIGFVLLALVGVVVVVAVVVSTNRSDDAAKAAEDRAVERANAACLPARPRSITHHGSTWSQGPYWQVRCPDGSVRVVPQ